MNDNNYLIVGKFFIIFTAICFTIMIVTNS